MIDLKFDDGKCSLEMEGSSTKVSFEIMMATHSLTKMFAGLHGMSFETAALLIMQGNSFINKGLNDNEQSNS